MLLLLRDFFYLIPSFLSVGSIFSVLKANHINNLCILVLLAGLLACPKIKHNGLPSFRANSVTVLVVKIMDFV